MRLREYFYKTDDEDDDDNDDKDVREKFKVKQKSFFTPSRGRDQWLDTYIELVKNDVANNLKKCGKLNLSRDEKNAFYSLLHNEDIVIRPADKGSGIVIVDKTEYIQRLHKEMTDSGSYEEIPGDLTETATKTVRKLVNRMYKEGVINKDLQKYLIPKYPKNGKLKGNPKLHKDGAPFRTIVSGTNTPTERMAEVAEHELNDFVINSPTYIKDTTDFINKLSTIDTIIPTNSILFCFDVEKLYPSVPRTEGLQACKEALDRRTHPIVPTDNALEMIETVLDFNGFGLGEKNYRQTDGIAIGSRLGRNFACAYMRKWDEKLLEYERKPFFYKRYIDDGFGIWDGDLKSLQDFQEYANNIHENIKIQLRWSRNQVEFLDTLVKLDNGHIYTDLYVKPTDKQLYLRQDSCHPSHTKKSLAYRLGIRIRRICERDDDYFKHRSDLKKQLRKRGYSGKLIEQQLQKVDKMDRGKLLENRNKKNQSDRVPLVLTYSKLLPDVRTILRKHQATLHKSERMREVFDKPPLLAFRRDKNLCDILVHRKTDKILGQKEENCECDVCESIIADTISDTKGEKSYSVVKDATCKDRNLIYALICNRCAKTVYVGETERTLKERTTEHRRDIKFQKDKPIMRHFRDHEEKDLSVAILTKTSGENKIFRLICEENWIKTLETAFPRGCNVKINL